MSEISSFDPRDPLARTTGEPTRANDALRDYALMGPGRSLRKLLDRYRSENESSTDFSPPTLRFATLGAWSTRYLWQARIDAYSRLLAEQEEEAWKERRQKIREKDWTQGNALRDLADQIISEGPSFVRSRRQRIPGTPRVVDSEGRTIQPGSPEREIITVALDTSALVKTARLGSQLERLAAEMETERQSHEHSGTINVPQANLDHLDDGQLARSLNRLSALGMEIVRRIELSRPDRNLPEPDPDGEAE